MVQPLTRDQRLIVRTLHDSGRSFRHIHKSTGFSLSQIQYACRKDVSLTPQKYKGGRPAKLSPETLESVIQWIRASPERRLLNNKQVCAQLGLPVSADTLRLGLKERLGGRTLHSAARKSSLTERLYAERQRGDQERQSTSISSPGSIESCQ